MESFATKPEFIQQQQQVAEPSLYVSSSASTINCRKKLDFNVVEKQHKVKSIKSMGLVGAGGIMSNYNSSKKSYNSENLTKIPSNTKRNARERKRVRTINDYFNQLQKYLPYTKPAPATSSTPGPKKLSKVETLKAAIEFIEYLQQYAPPQAQPTNGSKGSGTNPSASKLNCVSSPSSSVSSTQSLQSSPTSTTSTSFTSNMSLVEKLKIKCETPNIKQEMTNKYKPAHSDFHVTNMTNGQLTLTAYDSSYNPNSAGYTTNPVAPINHSYPTESEIYYNNYTASSYQYHEGSALRHQVSPNNSYSQYGGHLTTQNVTKVAQPELTSSPTYSTSSSECYSTYNNQNLMAVGEGNACPVDYNNNAANCFNDRFNGSASFQYQQYNHVTNGNAPTVQYC